MSVFILPPVFRIMFVIEPTVEDGSHAVYVVLGAAVPLAEDDAANATQGQQQSGLHRLLQGTGGTTK